ncbi:hypothetical protein G7084_01260 [Weissella coleopterorum]|uniref:Uncharacterized protein n=1 Tax=Weissella coleopterorum TaxID=2714949 RepID=A0A6G8AYM3_9LACO|nr:hypothetical protein [Weissella coleopterorum]QIL50065.1 hypothetical protein G7084_01260 [Weissella coleopterorum]
MKLDPPYIMLVTALLIFSCVFSFNILINIYEEYLKKIKINIQRTMKIIHIKKILFLINTRMIFNNSFISHFVLWIIIIFIPAIVFIASSSWMTNSSQDIFTDKNNNTYLKIVNIKKNTNMYEDFDKMDDSDRNKFNSNKSSYLISEKQWNKIEYRQDNTKSKTIRNTLIKKFNSKQFHEKLVITHLPIKIIIWTTSFLITFSIFHYRYSSYGWYSIMIYISRYITTIPIIIVFIPKTLLYLFPNAEIIFNNENLFSNNIGTTSLLLLLYFTSFLITTFDAILSSK